MSPPNGWCYVSTKSHRFKRSTQSVLPFRPGQLERRTPEYSRNSTTSFFAALDVVTGEVIGKCRERHRAVEFKKFLIEIRRNVPEDLNVHLIVDNYSTHSAKTVKNWLEKSPRFHLHFVPTHSSWLYEVEAWFSILTTRQIKRGSHHSVAELETVIEEFFEAWNEDPKPFKWTKPADEILENITRYCDRTLTAHGNPKDLLQRTRDPPHYSNLGSLCKEYGINPRPE